jgi:transcription initiation factor TFIIIB Brf1 subunit/transcription initiation factor TFIIB
MYERQIEGLRLIDKIRSKFMIDQVIIDRAITLYNMTWEVDLLSALRTNTRIASCIYMCLEDKSITQSMLSQELGCTDVSIRNCYVNIIRRGKFNTEELKDIKAKFLKKINKNLVRRVLL